MISYGAPAGRGAFDQQNVVVAQGIGHNNEVLAVDWLDKRLVPAEIIDVIDVAELLQQGQGVRAAPQPVAVVADRALTRDRLDHVASGDQELLFLLAAYCILGAPARTVAGSLMATATISLASSG